MRLAFNVLWVEDQKQLVQAQLIKLERLVKAEGFKLEVEFAASVDEAKRWLADDLFGDNVDLVLMDYNLKGGPTGHEGIREVRSRMPYKEVVFYSAGGGDIFKILTDARIVGVYLSTREDLPDTAYGVFETLIKKVLDIDHSRGIAMGVTSDIDSIVNNCLVHVFDGINIEKKAEALTLVNDRLGEITARNDVSAEKIKAITHLSELFEHHGVYSSHDRLGLLRKLLDSNNLHQHGDERTAISKYMFETIPKRNILAHTQVEAKGFSRRLFDRKGKEFTAFEMKTLRLELLAHVTLFEQLAARLSALKKV